MTYFLNSKPSTCSACITRCVVQWTQNNFTGASWRLKSDNPTVWSKFCSGEGLRKSALRTQCEGNPSVTGGSSGKKQVMQKMCPCHEVIVFIVVCMSQHETRTIRHKHWMSSCRPNIIQNIRHAHVCATRAAHPKACNPSYPNTLRSIFPRNPPNRHSPVRVRYGVSFVNLKSDLYSALVNAVVCEIPCNAGPRYNGTRLHKVIFYCSGGDYFFTRTTCLVVDAHTEYHRNVWFNLVFL